MHSPSVEPTESNDENRRALADRERPRIEVVGRETVVVSPGIDLPRATRTCTVECASGVRATDEWAGVPVAALAVGASDGGNSTRRSRDSARRATSRATSAE